MTEGQARPAAVAGLRGTQRTGSVYYTWPLTLIILLLLLLSARATPLPLAIAPQAEGASPRTGRACAGP